MFLRTPSLFKDYLGYLRTRGHTEGSRPSEMKQALAIDPRFFVHILYYHAKNMKIILQLQRKTKYFSEKSSCVAIVLLRIPNFVKEIRKSDELILKNSVADELMDLRKSPASNLKLQETNRPKYAILTVFWPIL